MKVWLITVGEPLPLPGYSARLWRTGTLAEELRSRGHCVIWWTSTVDHFTKQYLAGSSERQSIAPGLDLQFLHGPMYTRNISLARLRNHREIARQFRVLCEREERPDVILASYPTIELCDEAVAFGKRTSVPVLLDVRDLWPDEIAARLPPLLRRTAPALLWPLYRRARRALNGATGIVAISRTYLGWAQSMGRRRQSPTDIWVPLGYRRSAADVAYRPDTEVKLRASGVDPGRRIIWFCGTFVGSIDLGTAIEAARSLAGDSTFQFVFTGSGEREGEWRAQAANLPNVVFTGWAGREELGWLSSRAWAGLGAYKPGALMSLPNKLFEYMSAGLPILCGLDGEARELVQQYEVGLPYRAGDPADLVRRIRELADDADRRNRFSANAIATFREHFTSQRVYRDLADHLEHCARSQGVLAQPAATQAR